MVSSPTIGKYLIREEAGGSAVLSPVPGGGRVAVRPNTKYQILSALSLDNVDIKQAFKRGNDLVVVLGNGEKLFFEGYFANVDPSNGNARSSFEQQLPLQLSALDYEVEKPAFSPQAPVAAVIAGNSAPFPSIVQGMPLASPYVVQGGQPAFALAPCQTNLCGTTSLSSGSDIWLGILGLLGGLALGTLMAGGDDGSSVVNTNDSNNGGSGATSSDDVGSSGGGGDSYAPEATIDILNDKLKELDASDPDEALLAEDLISQITSLVHGPQTSVNSGSAEDESTSPTQAVVAALTDKIIALDVTDPDEAALIESLTTQITDLLHGRATSSGSTGSGATSTGNVVNNYYGTSSSSNTAPETVSVESATLDPNSGYATAGDIISVDVAFENVVTSDDPNALTFEFNGGQYEASYVSGNNSRTITFELLLDDSTSQETLLTIGDTPFNLNGATLVDGNGNNVILDPFPDLTGSLTIEPQPEIIEITAVPDQGEFYSDLDAGTTIDFFVKFDAPVSYAGNGLNLVLNTGDAGAVYQDQLNADGIEDTTLLRFTYTLTDGIETNDPRNEILPLAFNENSGDVVKSINGSNALVQISDAVVTAFDEVTDLKYDLNQPEITAFSLDNITTDGTTISRDFGGQTGVQTLLQVSGIIDVEYSDAVMITGGFPQLTVLGLYEDSGVTEVPQTSVAIYDEAATNPPDPDPDPDPDPEGTPTYNNNQKFQFTDLYVVLENPTAPSSAVSLTALAGVMNDGAAIIDAEGVPASGQLPADASIDTVDITFDGASYDVSVGAGPFVENSMTFSFDELREQNDGQGGDNDLETDFMVALAKDHNGAGVNYLDEYSGELKDLTLGDDLQMGVLRAIIPKDNDAKQIFITPLSELHMRAVEASGDFSADNIMRTKTLISDFFGLGEFVHTTPSFVNEFDKDGMTVVPEDMGTAVALAVLSTMDAVSGSLWQTLDILTPVFAGNASSQEMSAAKSLVAEASSIVAHAPDMAYASYAHDIAKSFDQLQVALDEYDQAQASVELWLEDFVAIEDDMHFVLDELDLTTLQPSQGGITNQMSTDITEAHDFVNASSAPVDIEYREWEIE